MRTLARFSLAILAAAFALPALADLPPLVSMAFDHASVARGEHAAALIVIANPNAAADLPNVSFTDTLPAGLELVQPSDIATDCPGSARLISASVAVLDPLTLPAASSCSVSFSVTAVAVGTQSNSVTATSAAGDS